MSEKSPSLMIKTMLGHLHTGVEKLESGTLSPEDMELLVEDAKELYERLIILRYKIYETNVLGVKEPVISAHLRQTEIETPIDLFGSIEEHSIASEPAFEVTFAKSDDEHLDEEPIHEKEEVEELEEVNIHEASIPEEDPIHEEEIEQEVEEQELKEPIQTIEDPIHGEEIEQEAEEQEAPTAWEPQFSGDQPIWMAEMEANIRDNRSVFPLESLIGAFTLNEKLQFINELFEGSSDDFSSHIKQLDQLASMDAARNMLAELALTFNWDTESEIVEDFIYKICRRHAAGT
ncbi:MAG: hypothetical protein RJB25_1373 [Bacteroidota bacterium]